MRDRIQEALKRSKADYTEIRIEEKESTRVVFRGIKTKRLDIPVPAFLSAASASNYKSVMRSNRLSPLTARLFIF